MNSWLRFFRFRNDSLRTKLLMAFIGVTVVSAGALAVYLFTSTSSLLRQSLERELTEHTDEAALNIGEMFNKQINLVKTFALNEILEQAVEDSNEAYTGSVADIQAELNTKDEQWRNADARDNNNDPLVQEAFANQATLELREFQAAFPSNVEVFITDVYGGLVGTTNRTSDYYQADEEWWQAAYNDGQGTVYLGEPEFDESVGALVTQIASPIRDDETGEIIGILRTSYLVTTLNPILDERVGETGDNDLFIPGEVVSHIHEGQYTPVEPAEYAALQAVANQGMVEMDYEGEASVVLQAPVRSREGNPAVDNLGWVVVYHQQQREAFAPVNAQIRGALIVVALVMILAVIAAFGLSLLLVRPIAQLTQTAEEVAAGNLNSRAKVASSDEIGTLASTFNKMTSQLQETLQGLEQRVAARTRDLQIVAEVGTATATILESKRLLQEVVDLTKERFNLYHSHIYLLDEDGQQLVLAAGAGEPGRQMLAKGLSIPLDREQSLVARAAREHKGVSINDVTQAADFLPNPLLPNTRSELAVPMLVGDSLIGVFDVQSDQVGRFTDSDVNIQTTMAAQLATSIQNVRSFEQSKKQAELESLVNAIGQKIQRATSVEDTLQTAIREIGLALAAPRVSANLRSLSQPDLDKERVA
jgi:GAF domain-containing protein/HAMP domain-containing protein